MLVDGIQLSEGSEIVNMTVASGTSYPSSPSVGELFYRTDLAEMQVYSGTAWSALGGGQSSYTITGDVTGTIDGGTDVLTLGTVNSNVGTFGTASQIPALIVNGKGLVTGVSVNAVVAPAGTLSGATLASNVVNSSLTSVGTLGSLTVSGNVTSSDPTSSSQLATKNYVDNAIAGLTWKNAVRVATTANITLSGTQTIDGVAVVAGDRVLVKNQTTQSANGIYVVASGSWARATDFDGLPSVGEVNGAAVYVQVGTAQADTAWTETATVTTVGTDPITFAQFSAGGSVAASSLSGTVLASNVVTSSLTSVGTLGSLSVTGTASAGSFSGAGTGLTGTATALSIGGTAAKATSLQATGSALVSTSTSGAYAGKDGNSSPILALVNASAGTDAKYSEIISNPDGSLNLQFMNDANTNSSPWLSVARSALTASNITLTGTAITLAGAVSATSVTTSNVTGNAALTVAAGNGGGGTSASTLNLFGGNSNTGSASGGNVVIAPGGNITSGSGIGYVSIQGAPVGSYSGASGGNSGSIQFSVPPTGGNSGTPTLINTLTLQAGGAWAVNGSVGTSGYVLTSAGAGAPPTWSAAAGTGTVTSVAVVGGSTGLTTSGGPVTVAGTITLAGTLNLSSGGTGATTQAGAANAILPSQASNSGKYLTTDGTNASWATVAGGSTTATNIAGGVAGAIPYQTATGTTGFSAAGTAGQFLISNGTGAPTWGAATGGAATQAALTLSNSSAAALTFSGTSAYQIWSNTTASNYADPTLTTRSAGTKIVLYSSIASNRGDVAIGVGTSGGMWFTTQNNTVGFDFYQAATRIFSITGTGALSLSAGTGTAGQVLTSQGTAAPTWTTPSASSAASLTGGTAGAMPYQSAASTTLFSAAGTTGEFLLSGGTGAPTWTANANGANMVYTAGSSSTPSNITFGNDYNRGFKLIAATASGGTTSAGTPDIQLIAGNGLAGSSNAGNIVITSGTSSGTTDGAIIFSTGVQGTTTEKLRILPAGAVAFGGSANYGTAGQALISAGSSGVPTWSSTLTGLLQGSGTTPFKYNSGIVPTQMSTSGTYVGTDGTGGNITLVAAGAATDTHNSVIYTDTSSINFRFASDNLLNGTNWLSVSRTTVTPNVIAFTATSTTFSGSVSANSGYTGPSNIAYTSTGNATFSSSATTNVTSAGANNLNLNTPAQPTSGNTGTIYVQAGAATSGNGGSINIIAGAGSGGGGSVNITAGAITGSGTGPGDMNLTLGNNAGGRGGNFVLTTGSGTTAGGTMIFNTSAASAAANGPDITFNTGGGTTQRGSINMNAFSLIVNAPVISNTYTATGAVTFSAGSSSSVNILTQPQATSGTGSVILTTGAGTTSGNTGGIQLTTGVATSGNSGTIAFSTGSATNSSGSMTHLIGAASAGPSGQFTVSIGSGSTNGGAITMTSGAGSGGTGGNVAFTTGGGSTNGGNFTVNTGSGSSGNGGNIVLTASTSGATPGAITLAANTVNVGNSGAAINFGSGAINFSGTGGNTSAPTMIIGSTSNSHPPIIQSPAGTAYGLTIQQGDWSAAGNPPALLIRGSDNSAGNSGALNLRAGNATGGAGAALTLNAGNALTSGTGNGGSVTITAGSSFGGTGGDVQVAPGAGSTTTTTGNVLLGNGTVVPNAATGGMVYIPIVNGTPTGTPATHAGMAAMVFDYTNNKIWVYNGAWKSVGIA